MNAFIFLNGSPDASTASLSILFGFLVLLLLGYIAYKITEFQKLIYRLLQRSKYEKILFKRERRWFQKYANIANTEFRTVTFTRVLIEVVRIQQQLFPIEKVESLNTVNSIIGDEAGTNRSIVIASNLYALEKDCDVRDFNLAALNSEAEEYGDFSDVLGVSLGKICNCGGYVCNWEADMFTSFVVDTTRWNVTSIKIISCAEYNAGTVISESSVAPDALSPNGFAHFTMNPPLTSLEVERIPNVKLEFKWIENGVERCVILRNMDLEPSTSANGSLIDTTVNT